MKGTIKSTIFLPIAVMLTLGVAAVYTQEPVKMTFSGTSGNSANNLQQPDTSNDEDSFAGTGTLGSFTLRNLRAISMNPPRTPPSNCSGSNDLFLAELAGGGVFRFSDGSLLYLQLAQGGDCIDLQTGEAHCTVSFQISGGTGRFKNAAGTLTLRETVVTVISDAMSNPVVFAATGAITGTVYGVSREQDEGKGY